MLAGGAAFLGTSVPVAALAQSWRAADAEPCVHVLGVGRRLSLYCTDGPARLLLACGSDGQALLNAVTSARHATSRRIDLLLLAGTSSDLAAHAAAVSSLTWEQLYTVETGDDLTEKFSLTPDGAIATTRLIQLGPTISVTIALGRPQADGPRPWRAIVEGGPSRIALLPTPESVRDMPNPGQLTAAIANSSSLAAALSCRPGAVIVPSDVERGDVEEAAGIDYPLPDWLVSVAVGRSARLRCGSDRLELPLDAEPIGS